MGKIDPKFTEKLVEWLRKDHTDEAVVRDGAMLLLQLNRNQGLYQRIMRNPLRAVAKLEYEIQKHVNYRLKGYTIGDIVKLDHEIIPDVKLAVDFCDKRQQEDNSTEANVFPHFEAPNDVHYTENIIPVSGKRPDHDQLPKEIQDIWPKNAERWKKIKETYNLLLTINEPCDRFEHLQLLKEAWYTYKKEMCRYDDFRTSAQVEKEEADKKEAEKNQRDIDYAHTFITKNLPQLLELVEMAKDPDFNQQDKLEEKRTFIQNRVDILLRNGVVIGEERKRDLIACDIRVELPTDNAEGNKPE